MDSDREQWCILATRKSDSSNYMNISLVAYLADTYELPIACSGEQLAIPSTKFLPLCIELKQASYRPVDLISHCVQPSERGIVPLPASCFWLGLDAP